ncbi:cell division protein FtsB [Methylohalomonas lacus]|uniref:Cell division protein FtsB n=1 Tax=Methylohalomonas lacus TaxID=398773 RepID=A0AAE3HLS7_9GAMM|nr:DUF6776 family protein [Methylohalomonas lacus]MCS3903466.1 cell division protein FtsB [Methylohalomonas lacus]
MRRHTIRPHQPLRYLLLVLIASALVGTGAWILAEYSHWQLIREQMAQNQDYKSLRQTNRELVEDNEALRRKLTMLQTGMTIDKHTTAELQDEVTRLQDRIFQLNRELEFYRGIVSSSEDVKGLAVQGLQLLSAGAPQQYHFRLVLTHVVKSDKVARGHAEVVIEGSQDGAQRTLRLQDVVHEQSLSLDYRFKHFKRFEGLVELPPAFKPRRVRVQLLPEGNSHAKVEKVFDWSDVTG